jgi:16S rRNA (uracil1498-N3)-methyltransferase
VARLQLVTTQRTVVDKPNLERLGAHLIEAAEQSGRTAVPELPDPVTLDRLLRDWPQGRALIFADETGGAPLAQAVAPAPAGILIGPEGGFTAGERDAIRAHPAAVPISLGPRILRADTAALAAVAVWQALNGQ